MAGRLGRWAWPLPAPTTAFATGEDQDVSVASENASDSYYYIGDSSYGLSTYLSEAVAQGSTKIHVGTSFTDKGTVTIPSSIVELSGYSEGFFGSGPKTVDFGYSYKMTVVFPSGSDIAVDRINFYKRNSSDAEGAYVEVQKGAVVHFSNCSFSNTPVVNGTAVFENCTFETGQVENQRDPRRTPAARKSLRTLANLLNPTRILHSVLRRERSSLLPCRVAR